MSNYYHTHPIWINRYFVNTMLFQTVDEVIEEMRRLSKKLTDEGAEVLIVDEDDEGDLVISGRRSKTAADITKEQEAEAELRDIQLKQALATIKQLTGKEIKIED